MNLNQNIVGLQNLDVFAPKPITDEVANLVLELKSEVEKLLGRSFSTFKPVLFTEWEYALWS